MYTKLMEEIRKAADIQLAQLYSMEIGLGQIMRLYYGTHE